MRRDGSESGGAALGVLLKGKVPDHWTTIDGVQHVTGWHWPSKHKPEPEPEFMPRGLVTGTRPRAAKKEQGQLL